jgi:hypothetical protein
VGQIAEGAASLLGAGVGGGFDAGGQSLGESAEVLDEDAAGIELGFHDGGLEEMVQRAAQAQPVQAGQNTCYGMTESVRKGRRDAGDGGRSLWVYPPKLLSHRPAFRHYGCGLAAFSLCVEKSVRPTVRRFHRSAAVLICSTRERTAALEFSNPFSTRAPLRVRHPRSSGIGNSAAISKIRNRSPPLIPLPIIPLTFSGQSRD